MQKTANIKEILVLSSFFVLYDFNLVSLSVHFSYTINTKYNSSEVTKFIAFIYQEFSLDTEN